jgi:Ser/Thr protein kinase RdoA (MazF antagonist)
MDPRSVPPEPVLAAWGLEGSAIAPITCGHINRTFRVEAPGGPLILQRLAPIFSAEVQEDIAAITEHLEHAGLLTPRLRPAGDRLSVVDAQGGVWRALTFVAGQTLLRADSAERCRSAGELLGRFHAALWDCGHEFRHRRLGVHDTERHLARLRAALERHTAHPRHAEVAGVGRQILEAAAALQLPAGLPERVVHGDPKISNVLFGDDGRALCFVDLDTLARMALPLELGDALRSWCSPQGEEVEGPADLDFYRGALRGYATGLGGLATSDERRAIPAAAELIAVELAARFCIDALEESYFAWDPARYESACAHNLARTRSQVSLARSLRERLPEMERFASELWG